MRCGPAPFVGLLIRAMRWHSPPWIFRRKASRAALDDYIKQTGIQLIYNADEITALSVKGARGALLTGIEPDVGKYWHDRHS